MKMNIIIINDKGGIQMGFKEGFFWGGATAANQYEGGYLSGGKGLAIQDVITGGDGRNNIPSGLEFSRICETPRRIMSFLKGRSWRRQSIPE